MQWEEGKVQYNPHLPKLKRKVNSKQLHKYWLYLRKGPKQTRYKKLELLLQKILATFFCVATEGGISFNYVKSKEKG